MAARGGRGGLLPRLGRHQWRASSLSFGRRAQSPSHNSPSRSVLGPRTLGPRDPESQGPKAQPNSASQIQESGNPPTVLISPSHSQPHISTMQKTKTTVFTKAPKLPFTLLHLISATFFGLVWLLLPTSEFFPRPAEIYSVKIMNM